MKIDSLIPPEGSDSKYPFEIQEKEYAKDGEILKCTLRGKEKEGTYEIGSYVVVEDGIQWHAMCVSTMAGCPVGCTFCATTYAQKPFERNLTAAEMEHQVRLAIAMRKLDKSPAPEKTTVGYMGNGEPLLNMQAIIEATDELEKSPPTNIDFYSISTTGIKPELITELADSSYGKSEKGKLQYSLISMKPENRAHLIPHSAPFDDTVPHLDGYAEKTSIPIKYNVPLIKGVNDSDEEADMFAEFIAKAPHLRRARVSNFNPIPNVEFEPTSHEDFERFVSRLHSHGIEVIVFRSTTDDKVMAGCGQMRAKTLQTLSTENIGKTTSR